MKGRGWLYALLGVLAGVVLERRLVQRRKPNPGQPRRATTAKPSGNRKLTREDVLRMIEENGGPQGLDLSERDLSNVDLSGMYLEGVRFQGAELRQAVLAGSWLEKCDFQDANLWRADLKDSSLWKANLDRADMKGCDLHGAMLGDASLRDTLLTGANLSKTLFHRTILSNTLVTREDIGGRVLLERQLDLVHFAASFDLRFKEVQQPDQDAEGWVRRHILMRHAMARETYLTLKNNFNQIGRYDDASWAYMKERQMEKKTHWPPSRARACYAEELEGPVASGARRQWQLFRFYAKHLCVYIADWVVELTCGYGEKPLRTLWWAVAVLLVFPVFYWLSGGIVSVGGTPLAWLDYLNYSLGAFTTIGFARFLTANWVAETLTSLEALLGISVLALLMFALGNRISRS
jgi:uncharacterized protein YjbI with pentapeptide repeats